MINIRVCRNSSLINQCSLSDAALRWGPDISDPLLTTEASGKERGRVDIDREFTNRKSVSITTHDLSHKQPGALLKIVEGSEITQGLLRSVTFNISRSGYNIAVNTSLKIESNV